MKHIITIKVGDSGTFLDKMLAKRGESRDTVPRNSRVGKSLRKDGVPACAEFHRIDKLPRRVWTEETDLEEQVDLITAALKTPQGTQRLWTIQAVALREIADSKGLVGGIRVSGGKTLIALLAPTVLGAQRPLIIVPAKSIRSGKVDKAYRDARQHWQVATNIQFVSYEMLQQLQYADLLEKYRPDAVIADEAHKWGRHDSARTARAQRFIDIAPEVPFITLSGTLLSSHIVTDITKLCEWSLKSNSPVPRSERNPKTGQLKSSKAQKDWSNALEVDTGWSKSDGDDVGEPKPRMASGALRRWLLPDEDDTLDNVRKAYGRRYTQTPGVVVSSGDALGQSLVIDVKLNPDHDERVEQAFVALRGDPRKDVPCKDVDGWIIVDPPVLWSTAQQLELGFSYVTDPRPPEWWSQPRQNWFAYCRERLKLGDIDTELQVANECRSLGVEAPWQWTDWLEVRDKFRPNVRPEWLSDRRVDAAAAWLDKHKALCWTQYRAFGQRLSERHGIPFFSDDACDAEGNSILEFPGGRPAVLSLASCSEDLDYLQHHWHQNLIVCPPSTGQVWEQFLARTHRFGQRSDEVTCEVWIGCLENEEALDKARAKERAVAQSSLDEARKLLIAEWNYEYTDLPRTKSRRWRRPSK